MQRDRAESRTPPHRPRPTGGSPGVSVERIVALQRAAGNAAVLRLLAEARHVHGAGCGHQPSTPVQRSSVPDVLRSPGRPLDDAVRGDMEARLGADFSDVRVHTGIAAQRSAAEIGARAYTAGPDIVIGKGGADRHTLAHELTHVIQQRQGPVAGTDDGTGLRISDPSDRFERKAEANAARALRPGAVVSGGERPAATGSPRPAGLAHSVQRVPDETGGTQGGGLAAMFKAGFGVLRLREDPPARGEALGRNSCGDQCGRGHPRQPSEDPRHGAAVVGGAP